MATVWIRLEVKGKDAEQLAALLVDEALDHGSLQDEVAEIAENDGATLTITNATVEDPPETAPSKGAVVLTARQARAAAAAVSAMLAGEGRGQGDWPEDITDRAMRAAAAKLGVR